MGDWNLAYKSINDNLDKCKKKDIFDTIMFIKNNIGYYMDEYKNKNIERKELIEKLSEIYKTYSIKYNEYILLDYPNMAEYLNVLEIVMKLIFINK
jgi:nicotinamide riboside kinase